MVVVAWVVVVSGSVVPLAVELDSATVVELGATAVVQAVVDVVGDPDPVGHPHGAG